MATDRLRVAVLFGGRSGEHEVSLMSAESVIGALDPEKYEVVPIGITKEGRWITGGDPLAALKAGGGGALPEGAVSCSLTPEPSERGELILDQGAAGAGRRPFDVVFPVLHGPFGEDGAIQGLFELADVPYVGAGVAASAVGMDKAMMKALFRQAGLPMIDYMVVSRRRWREAKDEVEREIAAEIGFPCFVKPANLGSSVGISKAESPAGLGQALAEAARYDRKLIVEKAAIGFKEVECSVLGNDHPEASTVGEIVPGGDFYDYRAKYTDGLSDLIIPARISDAAADRVRELALKAFAAIDAAGLARVDFFVHPVDETILVNEINTLPGFTRHSMYPKLWEASGLPYPKLLDRLIELALERHRDKRDVAAP